MRMITALLVGDRSIVMDDEGAQELYWKGFFGNPFTTPKPKKKEDVKAPLVLSPIETLYLVEKGIIEVIDVKSKKKVSLEELWKVWGDEKMKMEYKVYKELRDKGLVVKSGLKFGADFAVYEFGPGIDHAPFLVDVHSSDEKIDPSEMVRAGRVAHGVRKRFMLAIIKGENVHHIVFKWYLP
ncbi:tRNA-splicing endonuclease [Ignicoccus pacificus DSM 13166]|uniref:tRNA-splicing endonuclease n=1 Tax=Ignicoccus pacificus DSM 13166 TaxID=940294 RepID=A0A977PJZ3_9CREN|nr:tRNA-splicing endonuclease [Ignicoccus pacificus DSM 13166]